MQRRDVATVHLAFQPSAQHALRCDIMGVTNKGPAGKLETHNIETVAKLFALAEKCAREAEAKAEPIGDTRPKNQAFVEHQQAYGRKNKLKVIAALAIGGLGKPPTGHWLDEGTLREPPNHAASCKVVRDPQDRLARTH